jgi:Domain of unknown function (DUF6946)
MKIIKKIQSVEDWRRLAPPKRPDLHWKDGRGAKELANAWFPAAVPGFPEIPSELSPLLKSSVELGDINLCEGEPEAVVRVDCFGGESPNCDLLIHGACQLGKITIYVEAKADEPFGDLVGRKFNKGERINRAFDRGERPRRSDLPERIRHLTSAVLGRPVEECSTLRYQLLYGTAAALSAAKKYDAVAAIFVVHEFVTECTEDAKLARNANDLNTFVRTISGGGDQQVHCGRLLGPFRVPRNEHIPKSVKLFLGKATRNTRPRELVPRLGA